MSEPNNLLLEFSKKQHCNWSEIFKAQELSETNREKIKKLFSQDSVPLFSSDLDLVLFGSIARSESTQGSDIDWTLLVDSQADPFHYELGYHIKNELEKN